MPPHHPECGILEDITADHLNKTQKQLTEKYERKQPIFKGEDDPTDKKYVEKLCQRIIASKKRDLLINIETSKIIP